MAPPQQTAVGDFTNGVGGKECPISEVLLSAVVPLLTNIRYLRDFAIRAEQVSYITDSVLLCIRA